MATLLFTLSVWCSLVFSGNHIAELTADMLSLRSPLTFSEHLNEASTLAGRGRFLEARQSLVAAGSLVKSEEERFEWRMIQREVVLEQFSLADDSFFYSPPVQILLPGYFEIERELDIIAAGIRDRIIHGDTSQETSNLWRGYQSKQVTQRMRLWRPTLATAAIQGQDYQRRLLLAAVKELQSLTVGLSRRDMVMANLGIVELFNIAGLHEDAMKLIEALQQETSSDPRTSRLLPWVLIKKADLLCCPLSSPELLGTSPRIGTSIDLYYRMGILAPQEAGPGLVVVREADQLYDLAAELGQRDEPDERLQVVVSKRKAFVSWLRGEEDAPLKFAKARALAENLGLMREARTALLGQAMTQFTLGDVDACLRSLEEFGAGSSNDRDFGALLTLVGVVERIASRDYFKNGQVLRALRLLQGTMEILEEAGMTYEAARLGERLAEIWGFLGSMEEVILLSQARLEAEKQYIEALNESGMYSEGGLVNRDNLRKSFLDGALVTEGHLLVEQIRAYYGIGDTKLAESHLKELWNLKDKVAELQMAEMLGALLTSALLHYCASNEFLWPDEGVGRDEACLAVEKAGTREEKAVLAYRAGKCDLVLELLDCEHVMEELSGLSISREPELLTSYERTLTAVEQARILAGCGAFDCAHRILEEIDRIAPSGLEDSENALERVVLKAGVLLAIEPGSLQGIELLEKTIATYETIRQSFADPSAQRGFMTTKYRAFELLIDAYLARGQPEQAFDIAETYRHRWQAQEADLKRSSKLSEMFYLQRTLVLCGSGEECRALKERLDTLRRQLGDRSSNRFKDEPAQPVWGIDLLTSWLGSRQRPTVVLSYFRGRDRIYAWAVDRSGVRGARALSKPAKAISDSIDRLQDDIRGRIDDWPEAAEKLYLDLIAEITELNNGEDIVIVPDGEISLVPFAALIHNKKPLIEDHSIITSPGVFFLTQGDNCVLRPEDLPSGFYGGHDSMMLEFAEHEATQVAAVADSQPRVGATLTRSRVLQALTESAIVHLSGHAETHPINPFESRIEVGRNERITMLDIESIDVKASLVVLSACETHLGGNVIGFGLDSLSNAILRSGGCRVLSSLWQVSERATAELMVWIYVAMKKGLEPADALREATNRIRGTEEWSKPYFWAPFIMTGTP